MKPLFALLVYNFTIFFPTFFPFFLSKNHLNLKEVQSTNFLHQLFNSKYEKDIRPLFGSDPLLIDVSISVNDISAISEQDMVNFYNLFIIILTRFCCFFLSSNTLLTCTLVRRGTILGWLSTT